MKVIPCVLNSRELGLTCSAVLCTSQLCTSQLCAFRSLPLAASAWCPPRVACAHASPSPLPSFFCSAPCPHSLRPLRQWVEWLPTYVPTPLAYIDVEAYYSSTDTMYVGSKSTEEFVKQFLARATAERGNASSYTAGCASCASPAECIDGACVASTAHFHAALSPSFETAVFNRFTVAAGAAADAEMNPMWTEPYWGGQWGALPSVLLYQVDAPWAEWLILVAGLVGACARGVSSKQ